MKWYISVLKNYAVFEGRAHRKEYWMFVLFNLIIVIVITAVEGAMRHLPPGQTGPVSALYQLAVFIPSIAVAIRRMHDTDRTGWWILIPIVGLIILCFDGTKGPNQYGPDPKADIQEQPPEAA